MLHLCQEVTRIRREKTSYQIRHQAIDSVCVVFSHILDRTELNLSRNELKQLYSEFLTRAMVLGTLSREIDKLLRTRCTALMKRNAQPDSSKPPASRTLSCTLECFNILPHLDSYKRPRIKSIGTSRICRTRSWCVGCRVTPTSCTGRLIEGWDS